jgi:hypothetical protein
MMVDRTVEIVYFPGCPHATTARANVEAALRASGLAPRWQEWNLEDPAVPSRLIGYPSPSVLVGGQAISGDAPARGSGGLACRAEGAPAIEQIVAALAASERGARRG